MRTLQFPPILITVAVVLLSAVQASAASGPSSTIGSRYSGRVQPILKTYCLGCHSTEKHKGDLDLERFTTAADVLKEARVWEGVVEQIGLGEMPPKDKPQMSSSEKSALLDWVHAALDEAARSQAGDPGPVVLRRLNNVEYTHTLRDLTGVESLNPAAEFPADSAAGEGFMNTGNSLVMSPALLPKYLDAAKDVAAHAVLLPDGIRFSKGVTRRDWTEEYLSAIRGFYARFTDSGGGGEKVNLQGIVFDTNEGGRLPLQKYLAATLAQGGGRPRPGTGELQRLAASRKLNARYLGTLWDTLASRDPSPVLDPVRERWRTASEADSGVIAAEIVKWQKVLWKLSSVGHIGKVGGPKAWMEPVNPIDTRQDFRLKLPTPAQGGDITVYLSAQDAGDGNSGDVVVWEQPRLVVPGRPPLLLKDLREFADRMVAVRGELFASAAACLSAAAEAGVGGAAVDRAALARKHGLKEEVLGAWLDYLGVGSNAEIRLDHFKTTLRKVSGYDAVNGWGSPETPSLIANGSDQALRVPGRMKPHGVALHPSPTLQAAVGWRSPVAATVRVQGAVTHAHPECGNGVTWSLELRRGATRQKLAGGFAQGSQEMVVGPIENLAIQRGDLLSLLIGPRDGNHSCDTTDVDLKIQSQTEPRLEWGMAADLSRDILSGNPQADRHGNLAVWHVYTEPVTGGSGGAVIPAGSLLARWQSARDPGERGRLAGEVQALLVSAAPPATDTPDGRLRRQLSSLGGPLLAGAAASLPVRGTGTASPSGGAYGLPPELFGRHPSGAGPVDAASLCVQAPSVIEVRLPADLAADAEWVTSGKLDPVAGVEGSVQLQVQTARPAAGAALQPGGAHKVESGGAWTSPGPRLVHESPILTTPSGKARGRVEAAFHRFREVFPAALCYTKIVPVDEVVTLTLMHREDEALSRLMLEDAEKAELDRLWDALHFVSQDALTLVDAFAQLMEFATQDADPKVFEPLRKPIQERAAAFRARLVESEPAQLRAVQDFASRAFRRPLREGEAAELRSLYQSLRQQEIPHDESLRLTLARILTSPSFLYRLETAAPGVKAGPVTDWELATRLSYFLWSSTPDAALRAEADAGRLHEPAVLKAQARRMLKDVKIRRFATEFGCQWLHIHDFDQLDEKSERHFPEFKRLRGDMYEEAILVLADLFRENRPLTSLLDSDSTYLNESLAHHYGIPGVSGAEWRRVDGVRQHGRGGILGLGATLAKQSGASRTSPILRGNWVAETLLGDKLPRPPKDVPRLPEDEGAATLTVRQLTEKHSSDPKCSGCHIRIDGYGFALEAYDAAGRFRTRDLAGHPIDTRSVVFDGTAVDGADGLRRYLLGSKRDVVMRQFCRKLLGYALGRAVQLSDKPLLTEMERRLKETRFSPQSLIETILDSRQFREIRGRDMASN